MAKPPAGRDRPAPRSVTDPTMTEAWKTSACSGIALVAATAYFATVAGALLLGGRAVAGAAGARVGLAVGLALGLGLAILLLRTNAGALRARSAALYRGAWIGTLGSFGIILVMAYAPWLLPSCPPGAAC